MQKLGKHELLNAISVKTGVDAKVVSMILEAFVSTVTTKTLKEDVAVPVVGLGVFQPVSKEARIGRNPKTGEAVQVAASKSLKLKVSPAVVVWS
jgi:DNA-binding protein HU-beta